MLNILTQDRFAPSSFSSNEARPAERTSERTAEAPVSRPADKPGHSDPRSPATATAGTATAAAPGPSTIQTSFNQPALSQVQSDLEDYEFVLGRRQVASLSFVILVLISLFTSIAYVAGRSTVTAALAAKKDAEAKDAAKKEAAALVAAFTSAAPAPEAASPELSETTAPAGPAPAMLTSMPVTAPFNPNLFAEPTPGAIYVQAAALDRGVAAVMAEGLRARGFSAFVATGADEKSYRVLMGPFANIDASQTAKASLEQIGRNAAPRPAQK